MNAVRTTLDPTFEIAFDANGLVPAIAQDAVTHEILMVAWMDRAAFARTLETGKACYYSRSRKAAWMKGESSGHRLVVKEIRTDCDRDAVLLTVDAQGPGVCHEGYESCFFRTLDGGDWKVVDKQSYDPKAVYGGAR